MFTSFPVKSETFLQRELEGMLQCPVRIKVHSMWSGDRRWRNIKINLFRKRNLLKILWYLPYWIFRKPEVLAKFWNDILTHPFTNSINIAENFLGLAFAIIYARSFEINPPDHIHAVWSTAPATAALLIHNLLDIPFSIGAHAYDVFDCGGDWILTMKIRQASFIHTSTQAAKVHILTKSNDIITEKVKLIRRGLLPPLPLYDLNRKTTFSWRIISVGRLVEKKGYVHQMHIYAELLKSGIQFKSKIIGDGPLMKYLIDVRKSLGLEGYVQFVGYCNFDQVNEYLKWADVFIFTGIVTANGDRDGLPNVIPEAMAAGVIVLTAQNIGAMEAIRHNATGWVCSINNPYEWILRLKWIQNNFENVEIVRSKARSWTEENFNAIYNSKTLYSCFMDPKIKV